MKQSAAQADILVVNHHLFFADVAVKLSMGDAAARGGALPPYDAVIFDEAHQLEDIATDFFGVRLGEARLSSMLRDAERAFYEAGLGDRLLSRADGLGLVVEVRTSVDRFFGALRSLVSGAQETRITLGRDAFSGDLHEAYLELDSALELLEGFAEANATREPVDLVKRRAAQARSDAAKIVDPATNHVTWVEIGKRSVTVGASLVDVGSFLADRVLKKLGGVVLTSATLSATALPSRKPPPPSDEAASEDEAPRPSVRRDPRFSFVRSRLGIDELVGVEVEELHVESPFDHAERSLLYLPKDLPEPSHAEFHDHAGERAQALVDAAGGGAFVLSTSIRGMQALARALRTSGKRVLVQGDAPKSALLARFREHGSAVLVATMSFWEGVDVPGDALRLVIIDRIPFSVPTDPVVAARSQEIEARGGDPFGSLSVPQAAITLRQGFGRLLRSETDRGVVAVLDRRLSTKGYGKRILDSLPKARRTDRLDDVRAFYRPEDDLKARS
jgi:ATP-dependent DNA helicase DinG